MNEKKKESGSELNPFTREQRRILWHLNEFGQELPKSAKTHNLAEILLEDHHFYSPSEHSMIWVYDEQRGVWVNNGIELIRKELADIMGNLYTGHQVNEVLHYLRSRTYSPEITLGGPPHKIVMKNGIYDMRTGNFRPEFEPFEYHIAAIPIEYDPEARCPKIQKFLREVHAHQEDIIAILQFFGYCLVKDYRYAIIMMLLGEGSNGKSTELDLLKQFLGPMNVSGCTPQQLEMNRFKSAQLHGKLANIASDIPADPLRYTGQIKMLTGGDLINAEHKNRDPFDFVNCAKLIFSANEIPPSYDDTTAFHRRIRIIEFPNKFLASDPRTDPELLQKLTTGKELSGLFNLAGVGWKLLQAEGYLWGEKSIEEKKLDYTRRSDPVKYFALKCIHQDVTASPIPKSELYELYCGFCHKIGKTPMSDAWFGKKLKRFVPYLEDGKVSIDGKEVRCWKGITLKIDELLFDEQNSKERATDTLDTYFGTSGTQSGVTEGSTENARLSRLTCLESTQEKHEPDLIDVLLDLLGSSDERFCLSSDLQQQIINDLESWTGPTFTDIFMQQLREAEESGVPIGVTPVDRIPPLHIPHRDLVNESIKEYSLEFIRDFLKDLISLSIHGWDYMSQELRRFLEYMSIEGGSVSQ